MTCIIRLVLRNIAVSSTNVTEETVKAVGAPPREWIKNVLPWAQRITGSKGEEKQLSEQQLSHALKEENSSYLSNLSRKRVRSRPSPRRWKLSGDAARRVELGPRPGPRAAQSLHHNLFHLCDCEHRSNAISHRFTSWCDFLIHFSFSLRVFRPFLFWTVSAVWDFRVERVLSLFHVFGVLWLNEGNNIRGILL